MEQQLCRWLLISLDRVASDELRITQEQIGDLLGVRRAGISEAARRLQGANAIQYTRGHIAVSDRRMLEARACECYAIVKRAYERLASPAPG